MADAEGSGPAAETETDAAGAVAEVAAETAAEGAGGAEAMAAPEGAALAGSGCGVGVDGARSQAALGRRSGRRRRAARVLIGAFLLQENVG